MSFQDGMANMRIRNYTGYAPKHFIPTDPNLWAIHQYSTFLGYRLAQLHAMGKKLFPEVFA